MNNMREYENKYIKEGYNVIAGTDEAGRGPLVGPVVCACVVLPNDCELKEAKSICTKMKEAGFEARPFWKPIHLQQPYAKCPMTDMQYTDSIWQRIITLPCSTGITEEELNYVADAACNILNGCFQK